MKTILGHKAQLGQKNYEAAFYKWSFAKFLLYKVELGNKELFGRPKIVH